MKVTEQQLERAIYSLWDFQQALSALTFLLEDCEFDRRYTKVELRRFRCYETTLIVSMARPFEKSRGASALSLRATGIHLDQAEKELIDKVLRLRRRIVAHSDEGEMHFRSVTFSVLEGEYNVPHVQFDETLHLEEDEFAQLETLLRKLKHKLTEFLFELAQEEPRVLEKYKKPARLGR
jgi:hypothetical protein